MLHHIFLKALTADRYKLLLPLNVVRKTKELPGDDATKTAVGGTAPAKLVQHDETVSKVFGSVWLHCAACFFS